MSATANVDLAKTILDLSKALALVRGLTVHDGEALPGWFYESAEYLDALRLRWRHEFGDGIIEPTDQFLREFLQHNR